MILTAGMAHPRKLIRHAVVAMLKAASTAAGERVQPTRVQPHKKGGLPAIGVYTLNDPVDPDASTSTEETHVPELEIVAWVAHRDDYSADDAMDDIADQIENALKADPYIDDTLAEEARLVGTTMQVVEENGASDPIVGIVVLTYEVKYRSSLTAADPADDFVTVDATHKIPGDAADTPTAPQQFTVQEPTP